MQTAVSRIWTWDTDYIFYGDNRYGTCTYGDNYYGTCTYGDNHYGTCTYTKFYVCIYLNFQK